MTKTPAVSKNYSKDGVDRKLKVRNEVIPMGRWFDLFRLLFQSHHNIKESGNLLNFKMYNNGLWMDFEKHLMEVVFLAFLSGKDMIDMK